MDWDKLRIFHAVADAGSLTQAGDIIHLSQSAVSRQIRGLEESLNTTLFHRHARGLILTEQGELLFEATRSISPLLDAASARIRDSQNEVFGELRVTTTTGFGSLWLAPRLSSLFDDYPDLNIDLILGERVLDLPMREADVAIRMKEPSQADLIRKRLMTIKMCLFVNRNYKNSKNLPKNLSELTEHRLIFQNLQTEQVAASETLIREILSYKPKKILTVNNYFGVLQAVKFGLGVGVLPDYVAIDNPDLIRVLPYYSSNDVPVYLAYPGELRQSKRIAAFRDFVTNQINEQRLKAEILNKTINLISE
ncbi:MAG: LysR family transcriptional regulator [Proteobacteria bacterium]|nr:LysR family transcriptional regulator [Pseudomonadota bacterium]